MLDKYLFYQNAEKWPERHICLYINFSKILLSSEILFIVLKNVVFSFDHTLVIWTWVLIR